MGRKKIRKAVVLLSGGIDSYVALKIAMKAEGLEPHCLTVNYGQKCVEELICAAKICEVEGIIQHWRLVKMPFGQLAPSSLTDPDVTERTGGSFEDMQTATSLPSYVPGRNIILISLAAMYAEVIGASWIITGCYEGRVCPDTSPRFFAAMEHAIRVGTKNKRVQLWSFGKHNKMEVILEGLRMGLNLDLTFSCGEPINGKPCGGCSACLTRNKLLSDAREQLKEIVDGNG